MLSTLVINNKSENHINPSNNTDSDPNQKPNETDKSHDNEDCNEKHYQSRHQQDGRQQNFMLRNGDDDDAASVSPTDVRNIIGAIQTDTSDQKHNHQQEKTSRHSLKRSSHSSFLSPVLGDRKDRLVVNDAKRSCLDLKVNTNARQQQACFHYPFSPKFEGPDMDCHKLNSDHLDEKIINNPNGHQDYIVPKQSKHLVKTLSDLPVFVTIEDYRVASYSISGEPHLCLAQLLQYIKQEFPLEKVIATFEETVTHFPPATPKQIEGFKKASILPLDARSCPLIRRSDADWVLLRLFDQCKKVNCNNILNLCSNFKGTSKGNYLSDGRDKKKQTEFRDDEGRTTRLEKSGQEDNNDIASNQMRVTNSHGSKLAIIERINTPEAQPDTSKAQIGDRKTDDCLKQQPSPSVIANVSQNSSDTQYLQNQSETSPTGIAVGTNATISTSTNEDDKNSRATDATASVAASDLSPSTSSPLLTHDEKSTTAKNTMIELIDNKRKDFGKECPQSLEPKQIKTEILPNEHLFDDEAQNSILNLAKQVTSTLIIQVYHRCFGKCIGLYYPSLMIDSESQCIECASCHSIMTPRRFVGHTHGVKEVNICHWGFNSYNWRHYIRLSRKQKMNNLADDELLVQFSALQSVKDPNGPKPPRVDNTTLEAAMTISPPRTITSPNDMRRVKNNSSNSNRLHDGTRATGSANLAHSFVANRHSLHHQAQGTNLVDQQQYPGRSQFSGRSIESHSRDTNQLLGYNPAFNAGLLNGACHLSSIPSRSIAQSMPSYSASNFSSLDISNMTSPLALPPRPDRERTMSSSKSPPPPPPPPPSTSTMSLSSSRSASASSLTHQNSTPIPDESMTLAAFNVVTESLTRRMSNFQSSLDEARLHSTCLSLRHLDILNTFCNNQLCLAAQAQTNPQPRAGPSMIQPTQQQSSPKQQPCLTSISATTTADGSITDNPLSLTTTTTSGRDSGSTSARAQVAGTAAGAQSMSSDRDVLRDSYITSNMATLLRSKGIDFDVAGDIIDNTLRIIHKSRILF